MSVPNSSPASHAWWRQPAPAAALMVGVILLAWSNTWSAPFEFDDHASIVENATIRHLWPAGWLRPPATAGETVAGRPVLNLTLAVNHALGGLDVRGYHAVNLLIHTLAALALFGVLRRTFAQWRPADPANPAWAAGVALLWAVHPLQVESVTYIVQRAESLGGLCCLLTVYAFIRGATAQPGSTWRWFALAVGSCLLGIGTKETVVVAPVIVLLWDRTFLAGSFAGAWRARARVHAALFATWLPLAALVLGGGGSRGGTYAFTPEAFSSHWLAQLKAVVWYLRLTVWPQPLVFDRAPVALDLAEAWPYGVVLLPLIAAALRGFGRRTAAGFAGICFFILLAPSSLMPGLLQTIVEHRMYLALAAPLVLFVAAGRALSPRWTAVGVGAAALALGAVTYARNEAYRSELTLWADTAAKAPDNPRAHYNFGIALVAAGRTDEAAAAFRRTLELKPNHAFARFELGKAAMLSGRWAEAADWFGTAVQIDPHYVDARVNLGRSLVQLGRWDEAVAEYGKALADEPAAADIRGGLAAAHRAHGQALAERGDLEGAETAVREALRLDDAAPGGWFVLGNVLAAKRRFVEAIAAYQAVLARDPALLDARGNLANCLLFTGRFDEAIAHYEAVLATRPDDMQIRENLRLARQAKAGRL